MAIFLLDGGIFVGKLERKKYSKSKNLKWWKDHLKSKEVTQEEYDIGVEAIFEKDIAHIEYNMRMMGNVDKVIVCYDGIFGRRVRGRLYKGYKRHKNDINPKKHKGIDVRDKIKDFGFDPMNIRPNWEGLYDAYKEADDLIAEQAQYLSGAGEDVVILSEDGDMIQLLAWDGNIRLHNLKKEIFKEDILDIYGVEPSQYIDWKSLVGDVSDNIPGLHGVGPSKAKKLLKEYECLEKIPKDYFISYSPNDIENIAVRMWAWRENEGLDLKECKKKIGTFWHQYEAKKNYSDLKSKEASKLFDCVEVRGLFDELNHLDTVLLWKKLMKLPLIVND